MSLKVLCVQRPGRVMGRRRERAEQMGERERRVSALRMKNGLFTCAKIWTPKASNSSHFLLTGPDRFYMFRFSSISTVHYKEY